MKTIQEILKSRGLTKENYDTQGGSPFYVENIERAMEEYAEQFKVKNLNISDVSSPLPLDMIAKPSMVGGYYTSISYGNKLIATQGETVKELLENIVDAYKTLEASGNES